MPAIPNHLTERPVAATLLRMTGSMMIGFMAIAAFNVTDTYFVARLGTAELAAMGFTFPIVMIVHSIVHGIGIGTTSVLSRHLGSGNLERVQLLTSHALMLGLVVTALFIGFGLLGLKPLLVIMGAKGHVLKLTLDYMLIWLAGMWVLVIPIVGNNAIRATGDTLTPSIIMVSDLGLNIVLDPLFIFGFGPIPAMGIRGAALATVLSRVVALFASLYFLAYHKKMLNRSHLSCHGLVDSWRQILYVALPACATNLLMPITMGIITRLVSELGTASVAALSAGVRLEQFAVIPLIALGMSLIPFIGQNWGAQSYQRIQQAQWFSYLIAIAWGLLVALALWLGGKIIAPIFTQDPNVIDPLITYLAIMPIAFGFKGVSMAANGVMNAINRPIQSTLTTAARLVLLQIPLAVMGARYGNFTGVLLGMVVAEIVGAPLVAAWALHLSRQTTPTVKLRHA